MGLARKVAVLFFYLPVVARPEIGDPPELKDPPKKGSSSSSSRRGMVQAVGEDIKEFGESIASRVDRIVKKKSFDFAGDPWTFQGLPLIFPSSSSGFNLGAKVQFQNIRRQDPHKLEVEAQVLASDKGRYKHSFRFDYPRFLEEFRLTTRVAYDRDIAQNYYGIGNNPPIDPDTVANDLVLYKNTRAALSFTLNFLRRFGPVRTGPVVGLKSMDITAPAGSLLEKDQPLGIKGGRTHYLGWAIVYDTLDFEPYPSRGSEHELFFNIYAPFTGSDYKFYRVTYTYRRFIPLHRRLTFAHRTLFESLVGDTPYYELTAVGGSNSTLGLGGDRFFRGYYSNRFVDHHRLIFGFEMRWDPIGFAFAKQDLTVGIVPFLDFGRVWPAPLPLDLGHWHPSAGWGLRLIWNSRFVIRSDVALTADGVAFILNLGNSF